MRSIIKWLFLVIIFVVIITLGAKSAKEEILKTEQEDAKTEMLIVQGKAKIVFENYHVNNENGLKGEKMEDASLEEKYGITEIANFYKWSEEMLKEIGIANPVLKGDEYYLVNYDTGEVVYSAGYMAEDGIVYYKLSDIKNAENKEVENPEKAEESQEEVQENEGERANQAE